ncbi:SDR family NAD(P)-dependent oxidoreductase [Primorskyibacter aestuariivivens]|uniref:SDR family NAD(P)-dependent oxidoreductase n=1 Tax=Primorskyibacter aestuariivivens TaxID=1888912 RepID=UPI0023015DD2|nr:SDR family NAD(P)-dependent oxidoreductase [Primorskyibacter aestuariivivens]MDA7428914.1 SDR family NAD(P)-dependent oxidoreductase [Primorskyibacter aestuariivivens]
MADSVLFAGKNSLVFGAAGPVGRAICLRLAARGSFVVAVDSDEDALFQLARSNPDRIAPMSLDIADETAVDRLLSNWGPEPLHALIFVQDRAGGSSSAAFLGLVDSATRHLAPVLEAANGAALVMHRVAGEGATARQKSDAEALAILTRELASDGARINAMALHPAALDRRAHAQLCATAMMMLLPMSAAIGGAVLPIGQHAMPA